MNDEYQESLTFVGAANAAPSLKNDWLRLAAFGEYAHACGVQCLSREAAETMVRTFNSLRNRLERTFAGVPIYIGHPDDAQFTGEPGHTDTRAYGWIRELKVENDALWILPKWSKVGRDILENAFYKYLSPRWAMRPLEGERYEPVKLISVGLTNTPNIQGDAIANEAPLEPTTPCLHTLTCSTLGLNANARAETIAHALKRVVEKAQRWDEEANDVAEHNASLKREADSYYKQALQSEIERTSLENAFANERKARADLLITKALNEGIILPCEQSAWAERLAEDFDTAANALKEEPCKLHTRSETEDLKSRSIETTARREAFLLLVNQRRVATGEDYTTAWNFIKRTREDLYQAFCKKD